jgi:hypothetical protein
MLEYEIQSQPKRRATTGNGVALQATRLPPQGGRGFQWEPTCLVIWQLTKNEG